MSTDSPRTKDLLDVPLQLDRAAGSQARQVYAALREAILSMRLASGVRLPSSRSLADQIKVRRNAVVAAYETLQNDGLVEAQVGSGTFVAKRVSAGPGAGQPYRSADPRHLPGAFALGRTFADPELLRRLGAAFKRRAASANSAALGYGTDPRGSAVLRQAVAKHVAATRGIHCDPECIIIVSSTQQALRLCSQALLQEGDGVWFEDPGYPVARKALEATGLRVLALPVDAEGLDVEQGRRSGPARAAYVTPSMQFPTGVTMSMGRRLALIAWARETGAWIFEDDYDNEFRHEGPSLTALAGLANDRVVYFGTFSKMLFAGIRLGFVIVPRSALAPVLKLRSSEDRFPPALMEQAVADLLANGAVAAHTRRMRKRYRTARDALERALVGAAGDCLRVVVPTHGLHILAYLPEDLPAEAASHIREMAGIEAWLLNDMRSAPLAPDAFVLGFAGHETPDLIKAAMRLGKSAADYVADYRGNGDAVGSHILCGSG